MELTSLLSGLTLLAGFYMAWNIGANDIANAMGTSVGSKALTLRRAVILAAILEFSGAFFIGSNVTETIQHGIVNPAVFGHAPMDFAIGMLSALIATGALLQLASYFGLPVSTTHAIVGGVLGFGLIAGGTAAIQWQSLFEIVASWIISPLLSGAISYAIFSLIQRKVLYAMNPSEAAQKIAPFFVFFCFALASWSLLCNQRIQLKLHLSLPEALFLSSLLGAFAAFAAFQLLRYLPKPEYQLADGLQPRQAVSLEKALHHLQRAYLSNRDESIHKTLSSLVENVRNLSQSAQKRNPFGHASSEYGGVEKMFVYLQILSACLVAFAHGANDVANAIGPVNAVLHVLAHNAIGDQTQVPAWLLALGGGGIVLGLATWGWRVIETIGDKITELTPTRGFAAEFGTAATILIASKLGLPVSTTHALVGSVLGVGAARGLHALNLRMLKDIAISWIATIPLCALLSIVIYCLFRCFL